MYTELNGSVKSKAKDTIHIQDIGDDEQTYNEPGSARRLNIGDVFSCSSRFSEYPKSKPGTKLEIAKLPRI